MVLLLAATSAYADIYRYVDANGVPMLTDVPRGSDVMSARGKRADVKPRLRYQQIIARKADKYNLDPRLVSAIVSVESNFNPRAVSSKGAVGLMQLMPGTARQMGITDLYDPEKNIEGGTRYLKYLLGRYDGDVTRALAAYNSGPTNVERNIMPAETKRYIKKIYSLYNGKRRFVTSSGSRTVIYKSRDSRGRVVFTNFTRPVRRKASPGF